MKREWQDNEVITFAIETDLCEHLTELVIICDATGEILYANPATQKLSETPLQGLTFRSLLLPDAWAKGELFLTAAKAASPQNPTSVWDILMGTTERYSLVFLRGYTACDSSQLVILGQVEDQSVGAMQEELLDLTSELAEAQRELHRQNRSLQQAFNDQRRLLQTIQALSMPAIPLWPGVLLLPLIGHIEAERAKRISQQLLQAVKQHRAKYVILDLSGIAEDVAPVITRQLLETAKSLQLLGVKPVLVGIIPTFAQTIVLLGTELKGFMSYSDLSHALAAVLHWPRGVKQ